MPKISSGILLYKRSPHLQVLLVHPGGPIWAKKDEGAWSIPKGLVDEGEEELIAAKREFAEEIGVPAPEGTYLQLGSVEQKGGKIVKAWALEGDVDLNKFKSNSFEMEWPPRSGKQQEFPEVDKAEFFDLEIARTKINPAQVEFLDKLK